MRSPVSPPRLRRGALLSLAVVVVLGCGRCATRRMSPVREAAIADSLLALAVEYRGAWEMRDEKAIRELSAADVEYYWNGARMNGLEAIRAGGFTELEEYAVEMIDPDVEVRRPDEGVVSFGFRHRDIGPTGAVRNSLGTLRWVFERQDGAWKVARVHQTGSLFLLPTRNVEVRPPDPVPAMAIHYVGTSGHVGRPLNAELKNDEEICPGPWLATASAAEGELPPGLSFTPAIGTIEGTPEEAGTWTVRVLLEDARCRDLGPSSVVVPVTFTIEGPEGLQ